MCKWERRAEEEIENDNDKFTTPTAKRNWTFTAHKWPIHHLHLTTFTSGATLRHLNWLLGSYILGSLPVSLDALKTNMNTFWKANLEDSQSITPKFHYSHRGNAHCEIHKSCCAARRSVSDGSSGGARFGFPVVDTDAPPRVVHLIRLELESA